MRPLPAVGIVGLGIMGGGMAEYLLAAGYRVLGFDPADAPRKRFTRLGGSALRSATEVATKADVVITSLAKVSALDDAIDKIAAARRARGAPRLLVAETSTLPLADKDRAHERLERAGIVAMDCPISGTAVRLKERAWTIYTERP